MSVFDQTFELKIRFPVAVHAVKDKQHVLLWLADRGVTNLAEGMIDGIDEALGEAPMNDDAFGEEDASPVIVYDYERLALERLATDLASAFGDRVATTLGVLSTEAWSQAWNEQAEVIKTERFFVQVNAQAPAADDARIPLLIGTGAAFGSGRHATTEVCLRLLESLPVSAGPDHHGFLDVGTGTGILAIAASRLGYDVLVGTDIDAEVLDEARANAIANDVQVELLLTDSLPPGSFDVVAANILAPVLHQLMPLLAAALATNGVLLLAGFIAKEAQPIVDAASRAGLRLRRQLDCRGWIGLELERAHSVAGR